MTKEISSTCTTAAQNASFSSRWGWYRDLISVLLHKELEVRYKSSILGYLWSIMNPLAQAAVFYLVFSVYMRFAVAHYLVALLAALFAWQWFTNSVLQGPHTFLANPTLVKKVSSPRYIIPLVTVLPYFASGFFGFQTYRWSVASSELDLGHPLSDTNHVYYYLWNMPTPWNSESFFAGYRQPCRHSCQYPVFLMSHHVCS